MAIPKNVERQLAEAEALHQAALQATPGPDPTVITDASQLTQAAPPPVAPPAPPTPPAPPAPPAVDWEQRFKTVQGMYNAEVPSLKAQNRTMESDLTALKEQVRVLTQAAQAAKPPERTPVDPKDIESFGTEMIEMVHRQAQAAHKALRDEFSARINALEEAVTGVSKKTTTTIENQFYASLRQMVPDWQQINADERWLAWLSEVDPTFGLPRQAALDHAHQTSDAGRVAALFNQFKAAHTPPKQESLESQVAPVSTGSAAPPAAAPAAKPRLSQKFVQQFYTDLARDRYKGREAEAARIEQEINLAAAEGRIV